MSMARSARWHAGARIAPRLAGIERADSIAFDFHKWGQVPYDAGFVLVRDGERIATPSPSPAAYLRREARGLAGGAPWPCDFGPDLSRGFRALRSGSRSRPTARDRLGAVIAQNCALARYLEARIAAEPRLELLAPVAAQHRLLPLSRHASRTGSTPTSSPICRNAASPRPRPPPSTAGSRSAPPHQPPHPARGYRCAARCSARDR